MSRQTLKYTCSECGKTYTYTREEVKDNSLISDIWGDHKHPFPVWAICSDCYEERNESNLMWPQSVPGPRADMSCNVCDFEVRYPKALLLNGGEDSFSCPKCEGEVSE